MNWIILINSTDIINFMGPINLIRPGEGGVGTIKIMKWSSLVYLIELAQWIELIELIPIQIKSP